jgi:DNA-directed RNA polymerase subunit RPC12/RpoP
MSQSYRCTNCDAQITVSGMQLSHCSLCGYRSLGRVSPPPPPPPPPPPLKLIK